MIFTAAREFHLDDGELKALVYSDQPIHRLLVQAITDYDNARESLLKHIDYMRDTLDRLTDHVANGQTVNSLGELQGSGPYLDVACATYEHCKNTARHLLAIAPKPTPR